MTDLVATGTQYALSGALAAAPELGSSPGLSVAVATGGGDVSGRAQAVASVGNGVSQQNAVKTVAPAMGGGGALNDIMGFFGSVGHDLENFGSQALATLNKPLAEVQHEYRYLHDVEATHGAIAALGEGLGLAAGTAAGFALGGPWGAVLGADVTGALEGQVLYRDSWARSGAANYVDPHTRASVSFGRDIMSLLGRPGTAPYRVGSGVIDAGFDLMMDPLGAAGSLSAAGKAGELGDKAAANLFPTLRPLSGEDVETAYNRYPQVKRAFTMMAGMDSGQILANFQDLGATTGGRALAGLLGNASTPEEVGQIFKELADTHAIATTDRLPTMSLTRLPFNAARRAIEEGTPSTRLPFRLVNPANWAQRLSRLPMAYDQENLDFTNKDFSLFDDHGALGIYHMVRFGHTRSVAESVAQSYLDATSSGARLKIYRNAVQSTLMAMAHMGSASEENVLSELADGGARRAIRKAVDELTGGAEPGVNGTYGVGPAGKEIPPVMDDEGRSIQGAVTQNQLGRIQFPTLDGMRMAAHVLRGSRDLFGRADEFAYHYATQGIFKPLVLLTPSYALHISLAELIPNALRLGIGRLVGSALEINRTLIGLDQASLAEDHRVRDAIGGVVYRLLGGTRGAKLEDGDVQLAARYIERLGGHTVPLGLRAGEAYSKEVVDQAERHIDLFRKMGARTPTKVRFSKNFTLFGRDSTRYTDMWQTWLSEISRDTASNEAAHELLAGARRGDSAEEATAAAIQRVREWLDAQPTSYLERYERHFYPTADGRAMGLTPHQDWATQIVRNVLGASTGESGLVHPQLLRDIAFGDHTDANFLDSIEARDRPPLVKGREPIPEGSSAVQRIANHGFQHVLNPMVNFLSREGITYAEFKRQYGPLSDLVSKGMMDEDEAMNLALERAVNRVIRQVHNLHDRTQWTVTLRNFAPFWFAQEQAYRRFGRLLAENPGAFRRYQLMISNVHNISWNQTDGQGNTYAVFPGTGWMAQATPGILSKIGLPVLGSAPVGMGWSLSSTSVIFPLSNGIRPDVGPVAAIPLQAIANLFPEFGNPAIRGSVEGAVSSLVGGATASRPIWEQLIPNTFVQRAIEAVQGDSRGFQSSMMQTMQALMFEQRQANERYMASHTLTPAQQALFAATDGYTALGGSAPEVVPGPTAGSFAWQAFIDRLRNQTRIIYATRALLGLVTPVSPEVQPENWGLPAAFSAAIAKAGSVSKGAQAFLATHPDALPWTVFQSASTTGVTPPASLEAEQWIDGNIGLIQKYPLAAMWFMPQLKDTAYNPTVYNEQIAQQLRAKFSPLANPEADPNQSFLAQLYLAAGNATYYGYGGLTGSYQTHAQNQLTLTGAAKTNEETQWSAWLNQFEAQNPVWADLHNSGQSTVRRQQAIQQMQDMFAAGEAPEGGMSTALRGLLSDYNTFAAAYATNRVQGYPSSSTDMKAGWQNYLANVQADNPELSTVITGLFMNASP